MSDSTLRTEDSWEGPRSEGPGGQIGPFKILRKLGEGGFGAVFEAEQEEPIKRRVALKVIKLGMDTDEVIARFEAERQALAMMDHPHIARVLDAGATASGRPYFVMELVDGEPISTYCDAHTLSVVERLQLFDQVCAAVQHAHTKGIIHRDLKPNNVLVSVQDNKPFAKVIDFGIAKATSGRLTDRTLQTELNQVMGTPLYMSPEQAAGSNDIDTRTDIYSLGVMLYELLTGSTPVESRSLRTALFAEIQRIICEVEPPRPSARLAQTTGSNPAVAMNRSTGAKRLGRIVQGELDWIVMKALEKDRGRRYETANGLAMDIRRYLAAEPVLAAPPSASYRLQKFVRRNKGAVAAGSLIAASLIVGIVGFAWQAGVAKARSHELEQVSNFQMEMLKQINPADAGVQLTRNARKQFEADLAKSSLPEPERVARAAAFTELWQHVNATDMATDLIDNTILKPAARAVDKQFKAQPKIDATLREVLSFLYMTIGDLDAAFPLEARALDLRRRNLGPSDRDTLTATNNMGEVLLHQGKLPQARQYFEQALQGRRKAFGDDDPDTLASMSSLGVALMSQGKSEEAEPYYRKALAGRRRVLGNDHPDTLQSIGNTGRLLKEERKFPEAEALYRESLERSRRVLGEDDPNTLTAINNLGALMYGLGNLPAAEKYLSEGLRGARRVQGEDHPDTLTSINNMSAILDMEGKVDEAVKYGREAVDKYRRVLGDEHPDTLNAESNLGQLLAEQGSAAEGESMTRAALATSRRVLGNEHVLTVTLLNNLAAVLRQQGKLSEAEQYWREASQIFGKLVKADNPNLLSVIANLGNVMREQGKLAEAEPYLQQALAKRQATLGKDADDTLVSIRLLAALRVAQHRYAEAEALMTPIEAASRKAFATAVPRYLGSALLVLGEARAGQDKLLPAEQNLREAQGILAKIPASARDAAECARSLSALVARR